MMAPWHNQVCAKCGVTAELHGSCGMDGRGPMTPTCECDGFVFSPELYELATPWEIKLTNRITRLEEAVFNK